MKITLQHGEGGKKSKELIDGIFKNYFHHQTELDAARLPHMNGYMTFTTDSFVVKPIFFKGGNIGSLCVNGTINDLVASGSRPLYLSCGMIIEEGFEMDALIRIVQSIKEACDKAKVKIVTGDTKVVPHGQCDGIYINTSGIGINELNYKEKRLEENDVVIVTGPIADHGSVILLDRYELNFESNLMSDCAPLVSLLPYLKEFHEDIKVMKDVTRGGLATIINEIAQDNQKQIKLIETEIPIRNEVKGLCSLLGIDPMVLACEGRMVVIISENKSKAFLNKLKTMDEFKDANIIGRVLKGESYPYVQLKTSIGAHRILHELDDLILPRIC